MDISRSKIRLQNTCFDWSYSFPFRIFDLIKAFWQKAFITEDFLYLPPPKGELAAVEAPPNMEPELGAAVAAVVVPPPPNMPPPDEEELFVI